MSQVEAAPSAMYRAIRRQPEIVRTVLEQIPATIAEAAALLAGVARVFLVGTGTSGHAALVGEHLLRQAGLDAYASGAFDFVTYPRRLRPDDAVIVISHRGSKRYGTAAIALARQAGVPVVGLTGQDSPMAGVSVRIATAPQEESSTHTASYTANLAALAALAVACGQARGANAAELQAALDAAPAMLTGLLAHEEAVRPAAGVLAARGRMVAIGAGPNAATAREVALKVKESSYLVAEGFEIETALHGALPAVAAGDLAVVIAAAGPAWERTSDLLRALVPLEVHLLLVGDERLREAVPESARQLAGATVLTYPAVPEALSPLPAVIPLQLLAVQAAVLRGTNPDSFRADDPPYERATASYEL